MNALPHWNLEQIYEFDSPALKEALAAVKNQSVSFAANRQRLKAEIESADFLEILAEYEKMLRQCHLLEGYAGLYFSQNTQDQKAQSFLAAIDGLMAELGNELLFFELWWKDLDDSNAQRLLGAASVYGYWLTRLRSMKEHTLSEKEERIINIKNTSANDALISLYDSLCGRHRFLVDFVPGAEAHKVSREELMVYARSPKAEMRRAAYQALYKVYGEDGPILGQIYQTRVRDWRQEYVKIRSYQSPSLVRHKSNDLSPGTVESLLNVCRKNAPVFRKIFEIKAQALQLENFSRYDLYAPLSVKEEKFGFVEAQEEVLAAFEAFSPRFKALAQNIIAEKRFSAALIPGKQGGAFCASLLPNDTPWILMSFNGNRNDLFTMAHEMGHGIHSQLAKDHNVFHFHATLPLAETASTFGEMLLAKRLLEKAADKAARADLLFHLLDDAYATVCRQAFFAMFEIKAHEMIEQGATTGELAETYYQDLKEQFGPKVTVPDEFRWEWVSIPHFFHTPFYVYAYSFGQLLVYSLWRQYEKEGEAFIDKFISILSQGGSLPPEKILQDAGLGPLDENFWQGGFELISSLVEQLAQNLDQ